MKKSIKMKRTYSAGLDQKGVSLLMTFFIMVIALSMVISVSSFIYNEMVIVKGLGDSTVGFYAAYSGIEKALFYSQKNVCSIYPYNLINNPNGCRDADDEKGFLYDSNLYCNEQSVPEIIDPINYPKGCDIASCSSCRLSFTTTSDTMRYRVIISEEKESNGSMIKIYSKGIFDKSSRQINILDWRSVK